MMVSMFRYFIMLSFSKVTLFGAAYKVVESVDFYKIIMLDGYGEVVNNDNNNCHDYYKKHYT